MSLLNMSENNFFLTRRQLLKLACGAMASSVLWGCQDKQPSPSNPTNSKIFVFHNGTVLPVDESFSEHQAFAIQDNKILAIGSSGAMRALGGSNAEVIDLKGRTVLPGFIEPHVHFALMAFTGSWLDIGPLKYETTDKALAALKNVARECWDAGRC
jgi:hypothetical protein